MEKQGPLTKLFAPLLMNERQTAEVEQKAHQFERIIRETNNKNMQTDPPVQLAMGVQAQAVHQVLHSQYEFYFKCFRVSPVIQ